MKGQSSLEYFVIIGIVIIAISVVANLAWQENETSTRVHKANIAVNSIAATADNLYAQGPGAKTTLNIIVPSGYSSTTSSIGNKQIVFSLSTPGGNMDIIALTKANISGSPPTGPGMRIIVLETIEGFVNISSS